MKKSKKIISAVLSAIMLLSSAPAMSASSLKETLDISPFSVTAHAEDVTVIDQGSCGENVKYEITSDGTLTISPIDSSAEYASVDKDYFAGRTEIKNIVIEEGITEVKEAAFFRCVNVESISLPDTLVTLENGNLNSLYLLKSLHIPANLVKFYLLDEYEGHGESGFYGEDKNKYLNLEEITVDPKNPVYDSRDNCNALFITSKNKLIKGCKNTVVPASTEYIGDDAFNYCTGLKSITLPESVKFIGDRAFGNCLSLESINLNEGLISIGSDAFIFCTSLESVVLPSTVYSLGNEAFSGCVSLKSVVLSENLEKIPSGSFLVCLDLKEVTILEGVKEIGQEAFSISGLEEITLPQSLEKIDNRAFGYTKIKKYIVNSKTVDLSESEAAMSIYYPEKEEEGIELLNKMYALIYKQPIEVLIERLIIDDWSPELEAEFERLENEMDALVNYDKETDSFIYSVIPDVTIVGYQGSTAQDYATENGIEFTSCPLGEHTNIQFNTEGLEATCTEKGFIGGSACLDCETVLEMPEIIPAKGHTVVIDKAVEATCTTVGLTEGKHCSVCNEDIVPQVIVPATGHTDADGDNICDNCHKPVDSEEDIPLTFIERLKKVFSNLINSILSLFKRLFG